MRLGRLATSLASGTLVMFSACTDLVTGPHEIVNHQEARPLVISRGAIEFRQYLHTFAFIFIGSCVGERSANLAGDKIEKRAI